MDQSAQELDCSPEVSVTDWLNGAESDKLDRKAGRRMSCSAYRILTYERHGRGGFSVTVATEIEAYRLAHAWQHSERTRVLEASPGYGWLVQVYLTEKP